MISTSGGHYGDDIFERWLDGALSREDAAAVEKHAGACASCGARLADAMRSRHVFSSAPGVRDTPAFATSSGRDGRPAGPRLRNARLRRGATIGRYVLLASLGEGGMGSVWAAFDPELDRKVALKFLHPHLIQLRPFVRREAQAMARLSHPNVVAVYDVGELPDSGGDIFVAMEFVDGETLRDRLARAPRPDWREVLALFREAGRGLAAAHAAGVVHRDFKPQNVLVGKDGRVRVTDFGLARTAPADGQPEPVAPADPSVPAADPTTDPLANADATSAAVTTIGSAGTPAYMAPEQVNDDVVDPRADVFAFCASLYEALYDVLPFEGSTSKEMREAIRTGRMRITPSAAVPGWLRQIVLRGLRPDPADRFQSMTALLKALDHDPATRIRQGAIAAAVLALAAGAGVFWSTRNDPLRACAAAARAVETAWNGSRRLAMREAFTRTKLPYADDAFNGVAAALDAFAASWSSRYEAICGAGALGREPDAAVWLRTACLRQQLAEVKARSDLLATADPHTVEEAANMVGAIGDPATCDHAADPKFAPPPSPAIRAAVEEVRGRIAHAKALEEAGRYADAQAAATATVDEARRIGWAPLQAEALYQLGNVQIQNSQSAAAMGVLGEAALAAESSRHDEMAARALVRAASIEAQFRHADCGLDVEEHARAAIDRIGGDDALTARLLDAAGLRLASAGRYAEALEKLERAVATYEKKTRGDLLDTWLLNDLGMVQFGQGRYQEAADLFSRVVDLKTQLLGLRHPDVGFTLNNLGLTLVLGERYDDAERILGRAYEVLSVALPSTHGRWLDFYSSRGDLAFARGRFADAERDYARALGVGGIPLAHEHVNYRPVATARARALLALDRPADALDIMDTVLPSDSSKLDVAKIDPLDLADMRFARARAIAATGGDKAESARLAAQARAALAGRQDRRSLRALADIDAWQRANAVKPE